MQTSQTRLDRAGAAMSINCRECRHGCAHRPLERSRRSSSLLLLMFGALAATTAASRGRLEPHQHRPLSSRWSERSSVCHIGSAATREAASIARLWFSAPFELSVSSCREPRRSSFVRAMPSCARSSWQAIWSSSMVASFERSPTSASTSAEAVSSTRPARRRRFLARQARTGRGDSRARDG